MLRGWKHGMMAVEHGERRRAAPMNEKTMAFEELLTAAAGERFRRRLAALGEEESLRREYGSFSSLDRRIRRALGGHGGERNAAARRRKGRRRVLRRVLIAAAVLAALLFGMFTVSAQLRVYVKEVIVDWGERNMDLRYEVDRHQLTELPEGYGPHYIPEGYVYDEENSFIDQNRLSLVYRNKQGETGSLYIDMCISENASMVWTDNEHISYEWVTVNDVPAYLGVFVDGEGYMLDWAKDGIEQSIYFETDLPIDELYKIAENIY